MMMAMMTMMMEAKTSQDFGQQFLLVSFSKIRVQNAMLPHLHSFVCCTILTSPWCLTESVLSLC
jgi:hypothetical protein